MKTLSDLGNLAGKRVLMRVDFNVPCDKQTGEITNDLRIRQALPTIQHVIGAGGRAILMSHLGRPKGERKPELSLAKVADRLSDLLGKPVAFASDCIGPEAESAVAALGEGEVLMLENVRYHKAEEKNDPDFAAKLAALGDCYISDAFGTVHRAHASTEGVARLLPAAAGLLIEKEIAYIGKAVSDPEHPFVAVMGGAKVDDKIGAISNLLKIADEVLIGGAMAYAFLKAQGKPIGNSLAKDESVAIARDLLGAGGGKIVLPVDHVCAQVGGIDELNDATPALTTDGDEIADGCMGLDIGPKTAACYAQKIRAARVVTWNGPMGFAEIAQFAAGTEAVARAMADCEGVTIVGGGESGEAIEKLGLEDKMSHVSTGGGACLEMLAGIKLPGIAVLE